jgi:uncharacterized protein DUF4397
MNKTNTRFLSFAGLSLIVALAPVACSGDDDDDNNPNTGGTTNVGGKPSTAGTSGTAGKSNTAGTGATAGTSNNVGGGGDGEGGAGGGGAVAKTRLRVVHASPNAPAVDIYLKGSTTAALEGVAYGDATEFIEVDSGEVAFDLREAGAASSAAPAFTTPDMDLNGDVDYTVVAAGDFADSTNDDTGFRLLALEHDFEAAATGTAVARIVHATSAWETVDLDVVASPDVDVEGLDRFADENNVMLPSGATIDIDFQNTDGVLSKLVLPKLTAKSELFVIATGNPGFPFRAPANGFALLVVDQDGKVSWVKENPWLHVVHASDVGTVDIYESTHETELLVDDLEAEALSAFQLPASNAGFTVRAVDSTAVNGAATAQATGETSSLMAGEHYLTYIAGNTIQNIHEQFDLEQPSKVLLRAVHAAKSTAIPETLDIGKASSEELTSTLFVGIEPAAASEEEGVAINSGNLILGAAATTLTTPLLAQKTLSGDDAPVKGETDFVLVTGTTVGTTPSANLWLVNTSVAGWSIR